MQKLRTQAQNRAIHQLFEMIAQELNDSGLYIPKVIKIDAPWTKNRVKELIWRPTQETMLGKKSTTQLTTNEIDKVFEVIHKALAEIGLEIEFPSINSITNMLKDKNV